MAQFVGGRYQLIAQLGGGGMADVYLAKLIAQSHFAKLAVIKRLKPLEDEEAEVAKMFADEARLCARLNHPTIVQSFEVGEDPTGPFLVMEYIEGQPLGRVRSRAMRRHMTVPWEMSLKILRDTLAALSYAHTLADHDGTPLRIVHRDVSPENIMVTYAGVTKLVDFGVAKASGSTVVTRAGVLKGKVAYMAPEQARSDVNIDGRADVFAAGLLLWELLTFRRMWEGLTEARVFERLLDAEPLPRARTLDPDIPEDLDTICARAVEKEVSKRFTNAAEFLDALDKACHEHKLLTTDREIGQFVATLFEPEREKVRQLVTNSMKKQLPRFEGPKFEDSMRELPASKPITKLSPEMQKKLSTRPPPPRVKTLPGPIGPGTDVAGEAAAAALAAVDKKVEPQAAPPPLPEPPPPPVEESNPFVIRPLDSTPIVAASVLHDQAAALNASEASVDLDTGDGFTETPVPKPKKTGNRLALTIFAILAMVGTVLFAQKRMGFKFALVKPGAVAATQPALPPPPPPTPPAPPPEVTIDIAVKPASAKILIDGKPTSGNPYHEKMLRSEPSREIRCEADGFEPRILNLAFDRDRALELTLTKAKPPEPPPSAVVATTPPAVALVAPGPPTRKTTTANTPAAAARPAGGPNPQPAAASPPSEPAPKPKKQDKIDTDVFGR